MTEQEVAAKIHVGTTHYVWCDLCKEQVATVGDDERGAERERETHIEEHVAGEYGDNEE